MKDISRLMQNSLDEKVISPKTFILSGKIINFMPRRQSKKKFYLTGFLIIAIVIGAYIYSGYASEQGMLEEIGKPIPSSYYSVFSSVSGYYGLPNTSYSSIFYRINGTQFFPNQTFPLTVHHKLLIVYVGAEWCPFCAAERWALVIALSRFGEFSNLHFMISSPNDVFPNTPTVTFYNSTYTSNYICFQYYEYQNRSHGALMSVPQNYSSVWKDFHSSIPFIMIGGELVQNGSSVNPGLINGQSWSYVVSQLQGNTQFRQQVIDSANEITAAACSMDGGQPSSVCNEPTIKDLNQLLQLEYFGDQVIG
jgi:thiol-disulfide isomerase/thioredoxin